MLPLVQMHRAVQTPPHLDPLASFQAHLQPDYLSAPVPNRLSSRAPSHFYASSGASSHRVFPIRGPQPAQAFASQRPAAGAFHVRGSERDEHQLRRKTPNGTIDAGYDGSPAGLATGPPPLKQVIVPASSKIFPTAVVHRDAHVARNLSQLSAPAAGWTYHSQALNDGSSASIGGLGPANTAAGGGWALGPDMVSPDAVGMEQVSLLPSTAANPYNQQVRIQTVFAPSYQQSAGPTAFNTAGFNPPPVWRDANMSEYCAQVPLSNLGYIPQNAAYDSAYMAAQPLLHQGGMPSGQALGQNHPFGLSMSSFSPDDGYSQHSHNQSQSQAMMQSPYRWMESLSLDPAPSSVVNHSTGGDVASPVRFKERALAHAHNTYAELLTYLNHTKKSYHGRSISGIRPSSKMVVFPKPPKQPASGLSPRQHKASHSSSQHLSSYSQTSSRSVAYASRLAESAASGSLAHDGMPRGGMATVVAEIYRNPALQKYPYSAKPHRIHSMGHDVSTPLSNAKASLEMLSNLCEQSGWKWVDGMLLGGCLHYGLERYEEALEWFKRIIDLDARYGLEIVLLLCLMRDANFLPWQSCRGHFEHRSDTVLPQQAGRGRAALDTGG